MSGIAWREIAALILACLWPGVVAGQETVPVDDEVSEDSWERVARYEDPVLKEISGLAPSARQPGIYWSHTDSGGAPALYAIDFKSRMLGEVRVEGVRNVDWEGLAAFRYGGEPHLLIGDTGDNERKRQTVRLHAVPEPQFDPSDRRPQAAVRPSWSLTVRYADGPQDCEAVAVVPGDHQVWLLNKDSKESVVYTLPLAPPKNGGVVVAQRLAVLPAVGNATGNAFAFLKAGLLGTRATGMDVAPNGRLAAVLTYTDVRLFARTEEQSWGEALQERPRLIALPRIYQPEALCFSADNRFLMVSSEESPTPLFRYPIRP